MHQIIFISLEILIHIYLALSSITPPLHHLLSSHSYNTLHSPSTHRYFSSPLTTDLSPHPSPHTSQPSTNSHMHLLIPQSTLTPRTSSFIPITHPSPHPLSHPHTSRLPTLLSLHPPTPHPSFPPLAPSS